MSVAADRLGRWTETGRRLTTFSLARAIVGGLLTLAVLGELTARTEIASSMPANGGSRAPTTSLLIENHQVGVQAYVLVYVLALVSTVPLMILPAEIATVAACAANVLSLDLFHALTIASACAQVILLYWLGRTGSRLLAPILALPFILFALIFTLSNPGTIGAEIRALTVLLASLAPAAAWAGLAQHARVQALTHSAEREGIATTLLEHVARGERARIARELHDVVAHHISMIAVQAETARIVTPGMPDAGARRLLEIGDTARGALTEMRRLLGVLREDARAAEPTLPYADRPSAQRQPQPGLQQLNELLDEARHASRTGVRLIVSGPPATLDPGVELAAYRIIQEALTNARRHAPGAAVDVELHYTAEALRLRVRDNGPGPPSAAASASSTVGHGMLGMRERAAAVGGRLHTGPAAVGGFLVEATLPANVEAIA